MTLRASVVGCGFIGAGVVVPGSGIQSHAAAWYHHPGTELVGLADTDGARLAEAGRRWGVAALFESVDRLLAETTPDIVSVATPDVTHADVLNRVLEAPSVRAVLMEKPLALDLADAEALVRKAERRGIVLAVNYVRRYAPSHQHLQRWLATTPLGPIELVRGSYSGGLKHNGTHWIDLARFLVGEIARVEGFGPVDPQRTDQTIDVALEFESGARGMLHGLRTAPYSLFELDLVGPKGRVRISDGGQRVDVYTVAGSRRFPGFRELIAAIGPAGGLGDLLMHAASDVIEALATGRQPAGTGADAVAALGWAAAAIDDAARREPHGLVTR